MSVPVAEARIARFEKLAYGMFIHWGLYSQLGRGEWVKFQEKIPTAEYMKLKDTFTAEDFDVQYQIAPLRSLVRRPNFISLYITSFIIEKLINHRTIIDIYGTDEEIYQCVNSQVSRMIRV